MALPPANQPDIFAALRDWVVTALAELLPNVPPDAISRIQVGPPRDPVHGDMTTNAALIVGNALGMAKLGGKRKPSMEETRPLERGVHDLASGLAKKLEMLGDVVEKAEVAGPGFINIRLREGFLRAQLPVILRAGERYGDGTAGQGRRVDVEYVSANPTGPMHVGHCRGAVVGDALANLLTKAGWAVTKEYYVNDAGAQVQALAWAAYWRYIQWLDVREGKASQLFEDALRRDPTTGETYPDPSSYGLSAEEFERRFGVDLQYRGNYMVPVGNSLALQHADAFRPLPADGQAAPDDAIASALQNGWIVRNSWLGACRSVAVRHMMAAIRDDLAALGVQHDEFVYEHDLLKKGKLEQAEALLASKGLIYRGVLEPPKGKTPEDWEPREQTLFRATQFGDEVDRPLRKSDGTGTYFANDIANHLGKLERGFSELVHVWGADHGGYVKRMKAAVAALSDGKVPLDVVLTQIVRVVKNGEPVRMSKRAGTYVALRDLIDEVGRDAVRFTMLTRKADAQMEFDLDKVVEQSRDNPVFYVQYAHARCRSVLRAAGDPSDADLAAAPLDALADPAEMALIRRLAAWPRTVEAAAEAREPHRIAFFLHDLAAEFHVLWNKGREDATLRFIQGDEPEATRGRLALVAATAAVVRSGLAVMGVTPVEEMR